MLRFGALILVSTIAGMSALSGADARSCFALQAEMMNLLSQSGGGGGGDRSRFDRAYHEQARVIARTEQHAQNAGCFGGGFFLFRREQSRVCRTLVPKLQEMHANLARLDQLRRRSSNDSDQRIRELRTIMNARGCDLPGRSIFEASPDRRWLWEDDSFYQSHGTYRTLCVRTCDGYYFPISFSTVPDQFATDDQACQAMCPGAESRLYYHPNPGGGPENMVSMAGDIYTSLPTAFRYRESFDESCSCRPPGGYPVVAQAPQSQASVARADVAAPLPRPRPAPGEDPETLANRSGLLVPGSSEDKDATETAAITIGSDGRAVRIVGPVYWGAPEQDGVVITPVPN